MGHRKPRDVVKTPDEVADLPMHEEVDPRMYSSGEFSKDLQKKLSEESISVVAVEKLSDDDKPDEKLKDESQLSIASKYLNIIDELEKSAPPPTTLADADAGKTDEKGEEEKILISGDDKKEFSELDVPEGIKDIDGDKVDGEKLSKEDLDKPSDKVLLESEKLHKGSDVEKIESKPDIPEKTTDLKTLEDAPPVDLNEPILEKLTAPMVDSKRPEVTEREKIGKLDDELVNETTESVPDALEKDDKDKQPSTGDKDSDVLISEKMEGKVEFDESKPTEKKFSDDVSSVHDENQEKKEKDDVVKGDATRDTIDESNIKSESVNLIESSASRDEIVEPLEKESDEVKKEADKNSEAKIDDTERPEEMKISGDVVDKVEGKSDDEIAQKENQVEIVKKKSDVELFLEAERQQYLTIKEEKPDDVKDSVETSATDEGLDTGSVVDSSKNILPEKEIPKELTLQPIDEKKESDEKQTTKAPSDKESPTHSERRTSVKETPEFHERTSGKSSPTAEEKLKSGKTSPTVDEKLKSGKSSPLHFEEDSIRDIKKDLTDKDKTLLLEKEKFASGKSSPDRPTSGKSTPLDMREPISGKSTPLDMKEIPEKTTSDIIERRPSGTTNASLDIKETTSGKITPLDVKEPTSGKSTPLDVKEPLSDKETSLDVKEVVSDKSTIEMIERRLSGTSTPLDIKESLSGKSTPLDSKDLISHKSMPEIIERRTSGASTPLDIKESLSGKSTPLDVKEPTSGKSTPLDMRDLVSHKSTPEIIDRRTSDASITSEVVKEPTSDKSTTDIIEKRLSGTSTPLDAKEIKSGKSTPEIIDRRTSGASTPLDEKESVSEKSTHEKSEKRPSGTSTDLDVKEPVSGKSTPLDVKEPSTSGKSTPLDSKDLVSHKSTPEIIDKLSSGTSTPLDIKESLSGKSSPLDVKDPMSHKSTPEIIDRRTSASSISSEVKDSTTEVTERRPSGTSAPLDVKEITSGKSTPLEVKDEIPGKSAAGEIIERRLSSASTSLDVKETTSGKSTPLEVKEPISGKSTPLEVKEPISGKSTPLDSKEPSSDKGTSLDLKEPMPEMSKTETILKPTSNAVIFSDLKESTSGKSTPLDVREPVSGKSTPLDVKEPTSGKSTPLDVKQTSGPSVSTDKKSGQSTPTNIEVKISRTSTPLDVEITGSDKSSPMDSKPQTFDQNISDAIEVAKTTSATSPSELEQQISRQSSPSDEKVSSRKESLKTTVTSLQEGVDVIKSSSDTVSHLPEVPPSGVKEGADERGNGVQYNVMNLSYFDENYKTGFFTDAEKTSKELIGSKRSSPVPVQSDLQDETSTSITKDLISEKDSKLTPDSSVAEVESKESSKTRLSHTEIREKVSSPVDDLKLSSKEVKDVVDTVILEETKTEETTTTAAPEGEEKLRKTYTRHIKTTSDSLIKHPVERIKHEEGDSSRSSTPDRSNLEKSDSSAPNGMESEEEIEKGTLESERHEKESQILDVTSEEEEELKGLDVDDDDLDSDSDLKRDKAENYDLTGATASGIRVEINKNEKEDINQLVKLGVKDVDSEDESDQKSRVKKMLVTASSEDGGIETEISIQNGSRVEDGRAVAKTHELQPEEEEFGNLIMQARKEYITQRSRKTSQNSSTEEIDDLGESEIVQSESGNESEELGTLLMQARQELAFVRSKGKEVKEKIEPTVRTLHKSVTTKTTETTKVEGDNVVTITTTVTEEREEQNDGSIKVTTTTKITTKGGGNEGTTETVTTNIENKIDQPEFYDEADVDEHSKSIKDESEVKTLPREEISRRTSTSSVISQEDLICRKDLSKIEDFRQSSSEMSPLKTTYITSHGDSESLMTSSFYGNLPTEDEMRAEHIKNMRKERGYESFTEIGSDGERTQRSYFYDTEEDLTGSDRDKSRFVKTYYTEDGRPENLDRTRFVQRFYASDIPEEESSTSEMKFVQQQYSDVPKTEIKQKYTFIKTTLPEEVEEIVERDDGASETVQSQSVALTSDGEQSKQTPVEASRTEPSAEDTPAKKTDVIEGWGKPLGLPLPPKVRNYHHYQFIHSYCDSFR